MVRFLRNFALPFLALAIGQTVAMAQSGSDGPGLNGRVEGKTYVSATGQFRIAIPVLPELGGDIEDTPNVVTFRDDFNVYVTIAAFKQDASNRWEMGSRGLKDYLIWFFSNYVLSDFQQNFQGTKIESAKFIPGVLDGVLLTYITVPGGTMFADRVPLLTSASAVPVAKRGNFLFVKNGHIFVVSTELAERVIEGAAYKKTTAEEDELLRNRLADIVGKMTFAKPAPADAATAKEVPKK